VGKYLKPQKNLSNPRQLPPKELDDETVGSEESTVVSATEIGDKAPH
jgi:hypothetical protein